MEKCEMVITGFPFLCMATTTLTGSNYVLFGQTVFCGFYLDLSLVAIVLVIRDIFISGNVAPQVSWIRVESNGDF